MMLKRNCGAMPLLILGFLAACHPKTNNITVTGDSVAAANLYRDTSSPVIYITDEDSSMLTITGNHWPAGHRGDSSLLVFLDNREVHGITIKQPADGSFSFRLPGPVQIRMHQLKVSWQQRSGAVITAGINFSVKSKGD
jgi:hypothetical protein